jgi:hypothetical protein
MYQLCDVTGITPQPLCVTAYLHLLVIGNNIVLPITVLNFSGKLMPASNLLAWTTAQEVNSSKFDIESRYGISNFNKIGTVTANGYKSSYIFVHQNPPADVNYYRLKIIDKNNRFAYSDIIALKRNSAVASPNSFYPNPFTDNIQAAFTSAAQKVINIKVYDVSGRLIKQQYSGVVKGFNLLTVPGLQKLAAGIYFVEIKDGTVITKEKLVKVN